MWIVLSILFKPEPMTHRQHELDDELSGVVARDRRAENPVTAGLRQHLHEPVGFCVGDGSIELVEAVRGDLVSDVLFPASVSLRPTRAISGSVKVAQGTTE